MQVKKQSNFLHGCIVNVKRDPNKTLAHFPLTKAEAIEEQGFFILKPIETILMLVNRELLLPVDVERGVDLDCVEFYRCVF